MPRRKQSVPKKHGDSPEPFDSSTMIDTYQTEDEDEDEILDLSIKKKKIEFPTTSGNEKKVACRIDNSPKATIPNVASSKLNATMAPIGLPPQIFASNPPTNSTAVKVDNILGKLNSLVSKVGKEPLQKHPSVVMNDATTSRLSALANATGANGGLNFQDLWWQFVKKEENAEVKRINEAKQIFTCLQCQASFQTMDLLVKHMETTRHFANIPKHYSWSLQYARQKMRQMKMKMKYSEKMMYFCFLCRAPFTEPVHVHFNCSHNMHNPVENMKHVHIISTGVDKTRKVEESSAAGDRKRRWSRSSSTSTNGSDCPSSQCSPADDPSMLLLRKTMPSPTDSSSVGVECGDSASMLLKMEAMVKNTSADFVRSSGK